MIEGRESIYTIEDILRILPHRYPFLLVDRVVDLQEGSNPPSRAGRKIIAIKNISFNEPFFSGHFPHRPVFPGVLQIEAIAQAAALASYRTDDEKQDVALVSVKNAKFRRPIIPGDSLFIHAEITKDRGSIFSFVGAIFIQNEKVAEAEIMAKAFPLKPL